MRDEHLLLLPDTSWAIWRWSALRGAGFPVTQILQLAMPFCSAAIDFLLECEAEVERAREQVRIILSAEAEHAEREIKFRLLKMLQRIREGKLPSSLPAMLSAKARMDLERLQIAYEKREQAHAELQTQFSRATIQTMQALRNIAGSERFREAVLWQNRSAMHNDVEAFLHALPISNPASKQRKQAHVIAKYLQRYCTKNDSIGFFGPVGWARWLNEGPAVTARPGSQLLASRKVYFETWGIDTLGEALAQESAYLPWAVPRPQPFLALAGATLHVPFAPPLQLSESQASVLAACDGRRTAREVAELVLREPCSGLVSEAAVLACLHDLHTARRITWTFEVPAEEWYPERALRQQLELITPDSLRQKALATLDQLEDARLAVANAAGDVSRLDQALGHLEETFTGLTGKAAQREAGKMYAARTLVYEDCRRDIELTLGPALLQELAPPLTLLLTGVRWFTYTTAQIYRKAFEKAYTELARKTGSSTIEFTAFWSWIQPLIALEPTPRLMTALLAELQKRWAQILDGPAGHHHLHYTSQDLQARVQKIFAAPHAGWPTACYHSPDVMIAATSQEAVLRGEYQLVLGELHQGFNTLDVIALAGQHPAISDLLQAIAADFPEPRVVPLFPRSTISAKRARAALTLPKDWRFLFGADSGGVALPEQSLPIGQLVLEAGEGTLLVRTRDGSKQFELLEVLDGFLSLLVSDAFKMLAPTAHTPRITFDRLVVCRETWRMAAAELGWAGSTDALERYVGAHRWARTQKMPRFLFVRMPNETKPYYVDLESPIYVDLLAKAVRQVQQDNAQGATITFTEMLPDPEHCWLPDAEGNRYTSEIRMVVVDQLKPPLLSAKGTA